MTIYATRVGTVPAPTGTECPRCGITHTDYQRPRRWVLCRDCRDTFGTGWAQQARREIDTLTRPQQFRCGHPKTDANTYTRPDGRSPECLTCKRSHGRRA